MFCPLCLKSFHIILTKLVDNTKHMYETKNNSLRVKLQHNRRFDIVLHIYCWSITKTDKSENSRSVSAVMAE